MTDLSSLLVDIEKQRRNDCGGQAAATYLEAIWKRFDGGVREFSPAFAWRMALKESGKTGNVGVAPWAIFAVLQKYGCALEADYPYTDANLNRDPTSEEIKKAKPYRIGGYRQVKLTEINAMLDKGLPVLCLLDMVGGHFINVFGHDNGKRLIVNSWGTDWMKSGMYWMPESEFEDLFRAGFVITGVRWQWLKSAKKWLKGLFLGK